MNLYLGLVWLFGLIIIYIVGFYFLILPNLKRISDNRIVYLVIHFSFSLCIVAVFALLDAFALNLFGESAFSHAIIYVVEFVIIFLLGLPAISAMQQLQLQETEIENTLSENKSEIHSILLYIQSTRGVHHREHSRRMAEMAERFCEYLGLAEEDSQNIVFAAEFHDIGKSFVPEPSQKHETLFKNEGKNFDEHAIIGAKLLENVERYPQASLMVKHHHERWDGYGTPDGLKAGFIPLGSRIISLLDYYEQLIHYEPEKMRATLAEAVQEIRAFRGKIFDPELVDKFDKMLNESAWDA